MSRRLESGEEMPSCKECGKSLSPDAKFCPSCGAGVAAERVETTEIKNQKVDAGALVRCPRCGGVLRPTAIPGYGFGLIGFGLMSPPLREAWACPDCGYLRTIP